LLNANQNHICKREKILTELWGKSDYFNGRSLDVFIAKLRKYLKEDVDIEIENVHRIGYILKVRKTQI
jgi:DNA-binding response OmpR family regulator